MIQLALVTDENPGLVMDGIANDLKENLGRVGILAYRTPPDKLPMIEADGVIIIADAADSEIFKRFTQRRKIKPPRELKTPGAGWLKTLKGLDEDGKESVAVHLLAGAGVRGVRAAARTFLRQVLDIDPNEFWTGKAPEKFPHRDLPELNLTINAPAFPWIGYFDNDDDELANWRSRNLIIEFDVWKEMIDSLSLMGYNLVDIHDTLGRAEFWNWEYYKKICDYHTDLELVDKIIDYAHSKGMAVQIPMYLGWEFHYLPYEQKCLSKYMDRWMEVYDYYLSRTPLGKCDFFLQRPRDPWWDSAYRCCDECKRRGHGELMTEMFEGLSGLLKQRNPGARLVCDLWSEGRALWREGSFRPPRDAIMLWADNGWAEYNDWPEDFQGYEFGIYVHAGYFLNHLVQEPHADRLGAAIQEGFRRGMTQMCFVNGQSFKNFIFNIEAAALAATDPESFDPRRFLETWAGRYFGVGPRDRVVESFNALSDAETKALESGARGYVRQSILLNQIFESVVESKPAPEIDLRNLESSAAEADRAAAAAHKALESSAAEQKNLLDDQVLFPARLYQKNLECLILAARWLKGLEKSEKVLERIKELYKMLDAGSAWDKWQGWYRPDHQRIFKPPPPMEIVEKALNK